MYIYLLSAIFPPGGTNPEKAFRPLDRASAFFPRGGTLAEPRRSKVISAQPLDVIPKMENMSNQKRKEMFFPETFHLAERKWNVSFFGCVGVHLPRNVHLPSFRHLSAWRNKSGKSVQAPRPGLACTRDAECKDGLPQMASRGNYATAQRLY
jgi:hypothetical protein